MPAQTPKQQSRITPEALLAQIRANTAPVILDVRSRSEFERGHVPGAFHIPFWAALRRAQKIPAARGEPIVVYCGHGPRAGVAKAALRLSGFRRVLYLTGHMSGWRSAKLPEEVVPGSRQTGTRR